MKKILLSCLKTGQQNPGRIYCQQLYTSRR